MTENIATAHQPTADRPGVGPDERGDVPGWVLITLMTGVSNHLWRPHGGSPVTRAGH